MADAQTAVDIYHGRYAFNGQLVETDGASPFQTSGGSANWLRALHGFRWLRHMREAGTDLASANARALAADWLAFHGRHIARPAWDAATTARRIIAWLQHSTIVLQGADFPFYRAYLKSLAFQVRYLRVAVRDMEDGEERLRARIALSFAALALPAPASAQKSAARHLSSELERQILPDGGHISRNPNVILEILADLLPLRQTYTSQGEAAPAALMGAIDRMIPAMRFFRHADGGIARFNGMGATIADRVASVLRHDDTAGSPLLHAPHSGYQRLSMGGTTLIADTGTPPPIDVSGQAHAGCLSFEFSSGRHQYVVNPGVDIYGPDDYRPLSRATAAHSTVTINDTSSGRFSLSRAMQETIGSPLHDGPLNVPCQRNDTSSLQRFTASHDGYATTLGIIHEREISLGTQGSVIEGADRFFDAGTRTAASEGGETATIRFHLHPDAELYRDGEDRFVIGAREGDFWVFTCDAIEPTVEDSIFFAAPGGPRRSLQIVLTTSPVETPEVRWRFTRTRLGSRG